MEQEVWKDIKGYEKRYQISSFGNVKSLNFKNSGKQKLMVIISEGRNYAKISLGHSKQASIHRLVAETFIPNPNNKPCINHIDCNKKNNRVENLEWCTYQENIDHMIKAGRQAAPTEFALPQTKLSNKQTWEIKKRLDAGERGYKLAVEYNISQPTISDIKRGKKKIRYVETI